MNFTLYSQRKNAPCSTSVQAVKRVIEIVKKLCSGPNLISAAISVSFESSGFSFFLLPFYRCQITNEDAKRELKSLMEAAVQLFHALYGAHSLEVVTGAQLLWLLSHQQLLH